MIIRRVHEEDVPEISRWFESIAWDLPAVEGALPRDGLLALKDGVPVACAWIYVTGSAVAFVQWTNTNPNVSDADQADGIVKIIKSYQEAAPNLQPPVKSLAIYTKNEKFKEKLKSLGFRATFGFYQCTWVAKDGPKAS